MLNEGIATRIAPNDAITPPKINPIGNMNLPKLSSDDLKITHQPFDPKISKFDLALEIIESDKLEYSFEYSTELFKEETIIRFSAYFKNIVNLVTENKNLLIKDIDVISNIETENLI